MSTVKDRALPRVADGQKPVQARILYAMWEMNGRAGTPRKKSARVVGDVLGKFHPHGDASVYDAMVRIAQDFSLRYPLVDGEGNFGSRDGDEPAAMRYTEARLTKFAEVLLAELDSGTVDFAPNYDGSMVEPQLLPARLPVVLLNGASGIAVGMATEIPSHNLTEVANAAIALIREPELTLAGVMKYIKGPDFPGGGQIITPRAEMREAYANGRGSVRVRARWTHRAPRARAVAGGGARTAAGRLVAQSAGGNRGHHQSAAAAGQEIAHARAAARKAADAVHARHARATSPTARTRCAWCSSPSPRARTRTSSSICCWRRPAWRPTPRSTW